MSPLSTPDSRPEKKNLQKKRDPKQNKPSSMSVLRLALFIVFIASVGTLIAVPGSSTASANKRPQPTMIAPPSPTLADLTETARQTNSHPFGLSGPQVQSFMPLQFLSSPVEPFLFPQQPPLALYADDCVTSKNSFNLNEGICVRVSGAPTDGISLVISDPDNFKRESFDVTSSSQTFSYLLPSSSSTGDVDNRGTWTVALVNNSDASRRLSANFSVHDPNQTVADVTISKTSLDTTQILAGGNTTYRIYVTNQGPDAATNVRFTDDTLANTTFVSFTDDNSSGFNCTSPAVGTGGPTTCLKATMAAGETASFTAVYKVNTGVTDGASLTDTVGITSATTDSHGSSNSSTVTTTASNPTPPTCTLDCPANITQIAPTGANAAANGVVVSFPTPATSGSCGTLTSSVASGSLFAIGSTGVTFTEAGGQSCSFVVTVTDNSAPSISCPGNITTTETSLGAGATVNYTGLSATDNSGTVSLSCKEGADDKPSGSNFGAGTHLITCTASDPSNNSNNCSFNVIVNAAPACTLTKPPDVSVDSPAGACGSNVIFASPTTSSTSCDANTTITCDHASGDFFPAGETTVTCTSSPDHAVTSFTVTVKDVTAPVPDLATLPTITQECSATAGIPTTVVVRDRFGNPIGTKVIFEPPTATDSCSGKVSGSTTDPRTYEEPGIYTVHWTYTDANGNTSTQNQTINITAPSGGLHITGAPVVTVHNPVGSTACSVEIGDIGAALNTSVSGTCNTVDITRTVSPAVIDNIYTVGATYTVISTVTEGSNTSSVTQTLQIVDDTPPTITAPLAVTVSSDPVSCAVPRANVTLGSPTASVHCGTPTVTNDAPASFPLGNTTVTWTVTDTSGHTATATQTVTVVDNTKPVITLNNPTLNPMNVYLGSTFTDPGATATDNCSGTFAATTTDTVNTGAIGTYIITYNATDPSGNTAVPVKRTVNVIYNFSGFFSPVSNQPVLNVVNAGRAIPLKFSLSGNQGLNIFATGFPASGDIPCDANAQAVDITETVTAGGSSLSYSSTSDQYNYVWATSSGWAGTCRQLVIKLNDGTEHRANFKFR